MFSKLFRKKNKDKTKDDKNMKEEDNDKGDNKDSKIILASEEEITRRKNYIFPRIENPEILIVDDLETNSELLKEFLTLIDFEEDRIDTAISGFECLKKTKDKKYDIIFMDIRMIAMDGYQATAKLREHGFTGYIVGVTGMVSTDNINKALDSGMDSVYPKPLSRETLDSIFVRYNIAAKQEKKED